MQPPAELPAGERREICAGEMPDTCTGQAIPEGREDFLWNNPCPRENLSFTLTNDYNFHTFRTFGYLSGLVNLC